MMVRLRADTADFNVVVAYMPTSAHDDEQVEGIYEQIKDKIEGLPNRVHHNFGRHECSGGVVVGGHCLETRNKRGRLLIEFCQRNKLCIMNTWFKQPKWRLNTWKASRDCNRYQLDYIIVTNCYKNSVKNAHAYLGADANSDHNMIMMKVRLRLKRPHRTKKRILWDKEALKNGETVKSFNK